MIKKRVVTSIVLLFLLLSFATKVLSASADDLVIQDDGKVILVITNNGVLGVSTSPNIPEKAAAPAQQVSAPVQHPEEKKQSSPPPSSSAVQVQAPAKTVPLVPAQTQSTVQINPPSSNDKKLQVTITTQTATQPVTNSNAKSQSQPALTPSPTSLGTVGVSVKQPTNTSANVITKSVDQVVAQGADGKPVITIKSDQAHQLTITQGSTQVTTLLPLQIDTLTHALSISSKKQPTINVLPSEAIQGVLDQGLLNAQNVKQAQVNLTQDTNGVNYTVNSKKQGKLFGVFSIKSPVQITLSAQTGKVLQTSQSVLFSLFGGFIK